MSSNARKQLESWLRTIDVDCDSVIDIGGIKNLVQKRVKSWKVRDYKVLDYQGSPDYNYDLNYPIPALPQFDIAFCLEVMEYIWNPVQAIQNISSLIKGGGILYISFHFIYPFHQPKDKDYLRYTISGIKRLLKEGGLEIVKIKGRYDDNNIGYLIKSKKNDKQRIITAKIRKAEDECRKEEEAYGSVWHIQAPSERDRFEKVVK